MLGWLRTTPAVGQSFPTERLGIILTRRLPPPPDRGPLVSPRRAAEIFVTAVVWLVYNSRHDQPLGDNL
jgi:hypothetical protein